MEAIRKIWEDPPDVILLDVMMPGKDGFEVCEWVKSRAKISHIIIIMISANSDQNSQERALRLGASDYMIKPIHSPEVLHRVEQFLGRSSSD